VGYLDYNTIDKNLGGDVAMLVRDVSWLQGSKQCVPYTTRCLHRLLLCSYTRFTGKRSGTERQCHPYTVHALMGYTKGVVLWSQVDNVDSRFTMSIR